MEKDDFIDGGDKAIDDAVSALNNYLEGHAYLFESEYYGSPSEIIANYGFGYTLGEKRVLHCIAGGDLETCSLDLSEIQAIIAHGLTDDSLLEIMERCN